MGARGHMHRDGGGAISSRGARVGKGGRFAGKGWIPPALFAGPAILLGQWGLRKGIFVREAPGGGTGCLAGLLK